jgi:WD40 repeat protein
MSPEQARGEPTDFRGDLFSLGSVLYTMCAGRPPFRADTTAAVLRRVREDMPRPIRLINHAIPEWLCGVIDRLLAKDLGQRFGSAREVADLLDSHQAQQQQAPPPLPPAAPPAEEPPAAPPDSTPPRRSLLLAAACLGVLLAALAVFAALHKPWGNAAHNDTPHRGSGRAEPLELRRQNVAPSLLTLAGGGDPDQAPPELAAVLGNGKFLLPRVGQTAWMAQSPDGKVLAVPLDEDVVLFDAPTGRLLRTLKGPGGRAFVVAFSRDNQLLALTTRFETGGGSVRVWDLHADRALFTNPQPGMTISCAAAFSADGKRLFTEAGGRLHVQDARSGQVIQDLDLFPEGIASIDVSPDGRRVAVTTWKKCGVMLLDWDGERLAEVRTLSHPWPTASVVFSPDGNLLASSDLTGIKLWDARSLEEVFAVGEEADQLAFTPDGRTLLATTTTETPRTTHIFHRWDVVARKSLPPLSVDVSVTPARAFHCLSRDGKTLFVARQHDATYVKAIDTANGKELFPITGHVAPLNVVAISPDGRTVASAGEDWTVKLWDLAEGRVLHTLSGHGAAVCGLDFSPDGKRLASGSLDGTIGLWDVDSGAEVRALHGHSRKFSRVRFSPDGRTLAAGGEYGAVRLWDALSGQDAGSLSGHVGAVRCVAYSPARNLLASGGDDGTVLLHDLAGGPVRKLTAPAAVNDLAFSPDSRTLAAAGDGPAVCLWDVASGQETAVHGQHTGAVFGVTFSPSAPLLAAAGADGTVRLWERGADSALRTVGPGPFGGAVRSAAFTPDGRYLVTANANGLIYALRVGDDPRK